MEESTRRQLNPWIIIGAIMCFVGVVQMVLFFMEDENIWWTPRSMMLQPKEAMNKVRIFINEKPISQQLVDGIFIEVTEKDTTHMKRIHSEDIGLRLNNYYRVRSKQIPKVIISTVMVTVGVLFLVFGILVKIGYICYTKKAQEIESNST